MTKEFADVVVEILECLRDNPRSRDYKSILQNVGSHLEDWSRYAKAEDILSVDEGGYALKVTNVCETVESGYCRINYDEDFDISVNLIVDTSDSTKDGTYDAYLVVLFLRGEE